MKNNHQPYKNTLLFLMKVTLINVFLMSVTIAFSFAMETRGQGVLDRKVDLQLENMKLKDVLTEIESKADVSFTYRPRLIRNVKNVTLNVSERSLGEIFTEIFDRSVEYEVVGKQIILKENPVFATRSKVSAVVFQGTQVSGIIRDEAGLAIPGVNVIEKGTTNGTTTDVDGKYSFLVSDQNAILVFSFIGYTTQEVSAEGRASIEVTLLPDTKTLQEVVVVGYGEQKKVTVTGAVVSVKGADLVKSPAMNLTNSIAGRMAGVIAVNRSGEPGYDGSGIRIRGSNTLGNNDALIVIDGIPARAGGLERLNPNDIETISVLKDASAAIYGSRAANGVILVTTKRGTTGKPELSYQFNQGFAQPTVVPKLANAAQYAEMLNELNIYELPVS
ncbi:MAG TPA: TonB-dependent receptor plug domain-containing protein, partial [Chryseosolibacter sp.]